MKELIAILERKGVTTAHDAIAELHRSGVLTAYDVSVYVAQDEFMRLSVGVEKPMRLLEDIAHRCSISRDTLRRRLEVVVAK